jgi:glycosyltransferase involved in cell wall biosynthesis
VPAAIRSAGVGDPPRILSVGRLKAPKDFVTLARALRSLDPTTFRASIAGDGPDASAVAAELGSAGELLGERRDIRELLGQSDIFVLSSTSEGMPITILEAMAAGVPVVASDVGGVSELVEHGVTGLLVPPRDPDALAAALRRLLDDPQSRRTLGDAGRARAEAEFDLPRFRAQHLELYERVLAPKRSRR